LTVELVGTNQFQMFATVSIKKNLTLQQKRSRAAVDYSSCICKSGGEAARGSLPALSPQSDQVISLTNRVLLNRVLACTWSGTLDQVISSRNAATAAGRRAPGPGLKLQAPSFKRQAPEASSDKRQAPSSKRQA
jgi:hypothetical protein